MASRGRQAKPRRPVPRLYLVTPRDPSGLAHLMTQALGAADVAAVLLRLPDVGEVRQIDHIKALAPAVQDKGVALLLDGHPHLAASAGADGAHLDGVDALKCALAQLKPERIAGCGGLASRHDAMVAGEAGADYVMFGEPDASGARPTFAAIEDRIAWWAEVFESPCVGYAASVDEIAPLVAAGADFIALGDWIWRDPPKLVATIAAGAQRMRLPEPAA